MLTLLRLRLPAAVALICTVVACSRHQERLDLLNQVPTRSLRMEPRNTTAPALAITVPDQFQLDWTKEARFDNFIIFDPADSGDLQRGMIVINVRPDPLRYIPDSIDAATSRGEIDGARIRWRETTLREEPGFPVFQRETYESSLLKLASAASGEGKLVLHAFVVGTDSLLVERLMGSVESIRFARDIPDA